MLASVAKTSPLTLAVLGTAHAHRGSALLSPVPRQVLCEWVDLILTLPPKDADAVVGPLAGSSFDLWSTMGGAPLSTTFAELRVKRAILGVQYALCYFSSGRRDRQLPGNIVRLIAFFLAPSPPAT